MKFLMECWIQRSNIARLRRATVKQLTGSFIKLGPDVACEFQRKKFDISNLSRWKATQYRFVLLYCGPILLKNLLPEDVYQHFLLLVFACRILHSKNLMLKHNEYAKQLLRKFFYLLPAIYGENTQTLNMHNLIHVADDVKTFKQPLSAISAFWGENFIGLFKKLVKSPYKPLTQIVNRLHELEKSESVKIKKKKLISNVKADLTSVLIYKGAEYIPINSVLIESKYTLTCSTPNNIIRMENNKIYVIDSILLRKKKQLIGNKQWQSYGY